MLLALEVGEHGFLQRLTGAQDRFDIALLRAVEPATEQEQFRETIDVVQWRTKIMRQCMEVGGERVMTFRLPLARQNQLRNFPCDHEPNHSAECYLVFN